MCVDYTAVTRILTFSPNDLRIEVVIPILNDDIVEADEIALGLLDPQGQQVITSPAQAVVVITEEANDSEGYKVFKLYGWIFNTIQTFLGPTRIVLIKEVPYETK